MTDFQGPLVGLKVLDLATMMAAPWSATFLADFGADVLKIEHPVTGDHARHFGLSKDGEPVFWKTLARNKRSVTVDLKTKEGQEIIHRLIPEADVGDRKLQTRRAGRLGTRLQTACRNKSGASSL